MKLSYSQDYYMGIHQIFYVGLIFGALFDALQYGMHCETIMQQNLLIKNLSWAKNCYIYATESN